MSSIECVNYNGGESTSVFEENPVRDDPRKVFHPMKPALNVLDRGNAKMDEPRTLFKKSEKKGCKRACTTCPLSPGMCIKGGKRKGK